ncbi:MAG TPA: hypothetical protein VHY22_03600 [Chthoniobacteraceae bacterium]|jgi:hypothetical protein|nr:hypothetical protein [Chthoniobacteraceae bacterium]
MKSNSRNISEDSRKTRLCTKKEMLVVWICSGIAALGAIFATTADGQLSASTPNHQGLECRKMLVEPSASAVMLGKAALTVSPLSYKDGVYIGTYQIKVTPYFFKSQKGPLVLQTPGDLALKLSQGISVAFTGKATNDADNTIKIVKGKATPSNGERGAVTFSIVTDNGEMVFNTTYHLSN